MRREELARKLARETRTPDAAARDQIDELVHKIVQKLRRGQPVKFPGLGKLIPPPVGPKPPR